MKVSEIMTRDVCIARPDHTIEDVARMMLAIDAGLLPVGEDDTLVGTITDRDIAVRAVAEGKDPATTTVREAMSEGIRYCFEDQTVDEAADLMGREQIRRLPILNREKRLVGIVALGDLATRTLASRPAGEALSGVSKG